MADQDDFTFDEQDSDSEEWYEEEPEKKKKGGSRSRVLFLLLLLVAIAGGGYYYTMMPAGDDGPAAPPQKVVTLKKKPVAMPAKPMEPKPVTAPTAPAKVESPADEKMASPPAKVEAKDLPEPAKVAAKPVAMPVKKDPAPVTSTAPEKPVAEATPKMVAPKPVFETTGQSEPVKVAAPAKGAYTLTVGTYLLQSSVDGVTKKIRVFGYEPVTTPIKRKVTMTRLKVGTFPLAEAASRKKELKSVAPGVFGIQKGKMETVYVGSYLVLDKARRFADTLYKKGINLEEESVQIEKTLQRVTFGAFASSDEAKSIGRQAAAKGIEAQVYKNR